MRHAVIARPTSCGRHCVPELAVPRLPPATASAAKSWPPHVVGCANAPLVIAAARSTF
jgi:hypothetical protein